MALRLPAWPQRLTWTRLALHLSHDPGQLTLGPGGYNPTTGAFLSLHTYTTNLATPAGVILNPELHCQQQNLYFQIDCVPQE